MCPRGTSATAIELSLKRKDEKAQPRGLSGTAIEVLLKRKGEKADAHGLSVTTIEVLLKRKGEKDNPSVFCSAKSTSPFKGGKHSIRQLYRYLPKRRNELASP